MTDRNILRDGASAAATRKARSRSTDFLIFIVLPLLLTAVAMGLGAGWLLNGIAASVNTQEETRAWQAVQAGVGALENRLAGVAADNAHWDEAVRETYGQVNAEWVEKSWGVGSADVNYDTMFLLSGTGKVLAAFQDGARFDVSPSDYLIGSFDRLLQFAQEGGAVYATLSTIAQTGDGIAVVTAAPVLPTSKDVPVDTDPPNLAVFISHITDSVLERLGSEIIVDGLSIVPVASETEGGNILRDHWGTAVALAAWTPKNPGEIARSSYRTIAIGGLLGLIGVLVPLAIVYFRRLAELERNAELTLYMARHDQNTGLLNRHAFIDKVGQLARTTAGEHLALMLVEASNVRDISDLHGLVAGDEVIKTLAERLPAGPSGEAIFARLDGATFAISFKGADCLDRAEVAARNAIASLKKAVIVAEEPYPIAVSVGIATAAGAKGDVAELIRRTDLALSYARHSGINEWRLYDRSLDLSAQDGRQRRTAAI